MDDKCMSESVTKVSKDQILVKQRLDVLARTIEVGIFKTTGLSVVTTITDDGDYWAINMIKNNETSSRAAGTSLLS